MATISFPNLVNVVMGPFNLVELTSATTSTVDVADDTAISWSVGPQRIINIKGIGLVEDVQNGQLLDISAGKLTNLDSFIDPAAGIYAYHIGGLDLDAVKFFDLMAAQNWTGLTAFILSGNDTVNGSNGHDVLQAGNGNDSVFGYNGDDRLDGGRGNDTLTGGSDADTFVFDTKVKASGNNDRIADFVSGVDHIELDHHQFVGIGTGGNLIAANFALGAATTTDQHILYDKVLGNISYDSDGVGGAAAMVFAHVKAGMTLHVTDFLVG